jgi:hypothetical protein
MDQEAEQATPTRFSARAEQAAGAREPSGPDPATAAMLASIDRLDALGLETVEPATTFSWPRV